MRTSARPLSGRRCRIHVYLSAQSTRARPHFLLHCCLLAATNRIHTPLLTLRITEEGGSPRLHNETRSTVKECGHETVDLINIVAKMWICFFQRSHSYAIVCTNRLYASPAFQWDKPLVSQLAAPLPTSKFDSEAVWNFWIRTLVWSGWSVFVAELHTCSWLRGAGMQHWDLQLICGGSAEGRVVWDGSRRREDQRGCWDPAGEDGRRPQGSQCSPVIQHYYWIELSWVGLIGGDQPQRSTLLLGGDFYANNWR